MMLFFKKTFSNGRFLLTKALAFIRFNLSWIFLKNTKIENINNFELKVYSENGEDGILLVIFHKIGVSSKFFVEFGVGDGSECNTRLLKEEGWRGLWMDAEEYNSPFIKKEFITAENIEKIFRKYNIPREFDLLSIDIDGNDYWVWKGIKNYSPRVVVIEFNSVVPPSQSRVIPYDPKFKWDKTNYFGASLLALMKLGKAKGYTLIGCESRGVNAFFARDDLIKENFKLSGIRELYKSPAYGEKVNGKHIGYKASSKLKLMIEV